MYKAQDILYHSYSVLPYTQVREYLEKHWMVKEQENNRQKKKEGNTGKKPKTEELKEGAVGDKK